VHFVIIAEGLSSTAMVPSVYRMTVGQPKIFAAMELRYEENILYKNKYWRGTKFGKLANRHTIAKFKFHQYIFSIAYQL